MALDPTSIERQVEAWISDYCTLLGVPDLAASVTLEYSARMSRTLGKAFIERRAVRLASFMLGESESLLREVLCHEIAHLAASEIHGGNVRPHGPEWKGLMRRAGFEPRTRLPAGVTRHRQPQRRRRRGAFVWAHSCPRCRWVRIAGRPVRRWRCAHCYRSGREGILDIRKIAK